MMQPMDGVLRGQSGHRVIQVRDGVLSGPIGQRTETDTIKAERRHAMFLSL